MDTEDDIGQRLRDSFNRTDVPSTGDIADVHARTARRARRHRFGTTIAALALAVVGVAIPILTLGTLGGDRVSNQQPPGSAADIAFPATFSSGVDWNQISTGPVTKAEGQPLTWMTNTGFAKSDLDLFVKDGSSSQSILASSSFGLATVSMLGSEDVLILVSATPGEWGPPSPPVGLDPIPQFTDSTLPLSLGDATVLTEWSGQTSANTIEYMLGAQTASLFLDVRIFFGTPDPSAAILGAAQAQLNALVVPDYAVGSVPGPPTFASTAQWLTLNTSTIALDPQSYPQSWAATVPFSPEDNALYAKSGVLWYSGFPRSTITSLPSDGIVIVASVQAPSDQPASAESPLPSGPLHFDLSKAEIQLQWEGQLSPDVPQYIIWAGTQEPSVEVRVFFGRLDPSEEMLQMAQDELSTLAT